MSDRTGRPDDQRRQDREERSDLPRRTVARTAKLAALPLGYAGRSALGLGKRIGGRPAEAVTAEIQQRTAEQVFKTLGQLKGGAMKFGQMLSVLEAALPEEQVAAYRDELTRLQDSAPPMPTQTVRDVLARELGDDWGDRLVWLDGGPTAAASIGQVHRGRWRDPATGEERDVAVKVQYPGAGDALRSDLRQLGRLARTIAPLLPGIDVKPLVTELQERAEEELDYELEAQAQRAYAAAYPLTGGDLIAVPDVVAVGPTVLVTEWLESPHSLARVIAEGTPEERDHYGALLGRFLFDGAARTGLLHADPHPGNFRVLPAADGGPGRLGVLDFGAAARLPDGGLPVAMGRLIRTAADAAAAAEASDPGSARVAGEALLEGLRSEGFVKDRVKVEPDLLLSFLAPFVEPLAAERFRFTRSWMRGQHERLNDTRNPTYTVPFKLNLPPSYLLIHRTWLGGLGVLCQLDAEVPFRSILTELLPGFADDPGTP